MRGVIACPFDSAATALPWKQSPPSTTSVRSGFCSPQRVDHRAQRGEAASALEAGSSVLVEELVVDLELGVNVGRVQDGEVPRAATFHRLASCQIGRREAEPHRADMLQEFAAATQGHVKGLL